MILGLLFRFLKARPRAFFSTFIMSISPPDLSSLSLSSRPSQQRLHDTYDYDANRSPFHFATSQGLPQSPYNPLTSITQSPIKNKPVRSAIPTVCFSPWIFFDYPPHLPSLSNGLTTLLQIVGRSLLKTTLIFLPLAVLPLWVILMLLPPPSRLAVLIQTTISFPQPLSSKIYHLTLSVKPYSI